MLGFDMLPLTLGTALTSDDNDVPLLDKGQERCILIVTPEVARFAMLRLKLIGQRKMKLT